jgi:hypothetical protein
VYIWRVRLARNTRLLNERTRLREVSAALRRAYVQAGTRSWQPGAPFGDRSVNFEVMREWNRSVIYRKTIVLFAERLAK